MVSKKGGRRVGAGRKRKPVQEKTRNRVGLGFTDAEIAELREHALDEPLASYIRRLVLKHLERMRRR